MKSKAKIKYCDETGKYCYSSEAKATRAKNRYDDINRVYFCESCESFHTTKIGINLAIQEGIIEPKELKEISPEDIQQEINKLDKIIKES